MPVGIREVTGFRVVVSHPDSVFFPDESGTDIGTFSKTNIAVEVTHIQRLQDPYPSNCTYSWNQTGYSDAMLGSDIEYSTGVRK